eukprot:CAMPEP_0176046316 /NCGR_PEP_ID=MMETSP0120_2-20121206/22997_1 /TAXON_ID=160619 /ORGANISM="Kryptoperidinium foliaceum, Strain CCMP 1326" /LENGTH=577 /DNA_ID=CAMNT_0017379727 /DNA_START=62 /DNA_END=1792 /DNA_ORIENTATION=+
MGRLAEHRWLDEQIAQSLMVKNAFMDMPEMTDGSAPQPSTPPCRCSTTSPSGTAGHDGVPHDVCDGGDGSGSETISASVCGAGHEAAGSLATTIMTPTPSSQASWAGAMPSLLLEDEVDQDEDGHLVGWNLAVRRTFFQCRCWEEPAIRRVASMPELRGQRGDSPETMQEEEARGCMSPGADHDIHWDESSALFVEPWSAQYWPETSATDQEQQCQPVFICVPAEAMCEYYDDGSGFVAPALGIDEDCSWPSEYDQAAQEEEAAGAPAVASTRSRKTRRSVDRHCDAGAADPLQIIADANDAACGCFEGQVWALSCRDGASSLGVQRAIAILARVLRDPVAGQRWRVQFDVEALVGQLRGHVLEAIQHPHANHVIKQVLDMMPSEYAAFVADELVGSGVWAAKHKFGCRAILRLVQHASSDSWESASAKEVLSEVLQEADELCRDEFGKFVLEEIIERGLPEQRQLALSALRARLARNARHEHASFLIQRALRSIGSGREDGTSEMADELLASRDAAQSLARNQFGRYVLRDLARSAKHARRARDLLTPLTGELQGSKQGKKLLMDLSTEGEFASHW